MTQINQLNETVSPSGSDQIPVYKSDQGSARKLSLTNLLEWVKDNLSVSKTITQLAAPNSAGFTITTTGTDDIRLIINPTGTLTSGTIVLPTTPAERQKLVITSTNQITSLTLSSAKIIQGAVTTIAANGFFTYQYDASFQKWYRIG